MNKVPRHDVQKHSVAMGALNTAFHVYATLYTPTLITRVASLLVAI
ncbi:MAG: hypothetical protein Q7U28_13450 [Aquabacterium sp.]|nr:hypothetical protein [Aquabacterium sp.]